MKEKFTDAIVTYWNGDERKIEFCTNRNLTKRLKLLNRCSWIIDIKIEYYNDGVNLGCEVLKSKVS